MRKIVFLCVLLILLGGLAQPGFCEDQYPHQPQPPTHMAPDHSIGNPDEQQNNTGIIDQIKAFFTDDFSMAGWKLILYVFLLSFASAAVVYVWHCFQNKDNQQTNNMMKDLEKKLDKLDNYINDKNKSIDSMRTTVNSYSPKNIETKISAVRGSYNKLKTQRESTAKNIQKVIECILAMESATDVLMAWIEESGLDEIQRNEAKKELNIQIQGLKQLRNTRQENIENILVDDSLFNWLEEFAKLLNRVHTKSE